MVVDTDKASMGTWGLVMQTLVGAWTCDGTLTTVERAGSSVQEMDGCAATGSAWTSIGTPPAAVDAATSAKRPILASMENAAALLRVFRIAQVRNYVIHLPSLSFKLACE